MIIWNHLFKWGIDNFKKMLQRFFKANASDTWTCTNFSIFSSKVHPSLWASLLWPPSLTPWPWMVGRDERLRSLVVGHVFDTPNLVNGAVAWRPSRVVLRGQMVKCNSIQHYMLYWFVQYDVWWCMLYHVIWKYYAWCMGHDDDDHNNTYWWSWLFSVFLSIALTVVVIDCNISV